VVVEAGSTSISGVSPDPGTIEVSQLGRCGFGVADQGESAQASRWAGDGFGADRRAELSVLFGMVATVMEPTVGVVRFSWEGL